MTLFSTIALDLKRRLRTGMPLPVPLTLEGISSHYDVSITPVRAAVAQLISEGVLLKLSNGRLEPGQYSQGGESDETDSARTADTVVESSGQLLAMIERDLVQLSLQESPVAIREEAAARKYGISRSAMRQILHRLAGQGLVTHRPRHGWQLRPFRQVDMEAFLEVRAVLEIRALELAWPRLQPKSIEAILDGNRLAEVPGLPPKIDNSLHRYILETAGNSYILDFFDRHGHYYELLFEWEDLNQAAAEEAVMQHRQILEAMLRQDRDAARSALDQHIRGNHPVLRDLPVRKVQATIQHRFPASSASLAALVPVPACDPALFSEGEPE